MYLDFLLNLDNKEVFIEILHHSVDYLIKRETDGFLIEKIANKYGFEKTTEFESTLKTIANAYKLYCLNSLTDKELLGYFSHVSRDLQESVLDVVAARKSELITFLIREHDSRNGKLLESFDWDVRFVMGNSSLSSHRSQLATIILNSTEPNGVRSAVNFELTQPMLEKMIKELESCREKIDSLKTKDVALSAATT